MNKFKIFKKTNTKNTHKHYTKIKFRVRIYLQNENDKIICFQKPDDFSKYLSYYNKERGVKDSLSLSFINNKLKHELYDVNNFNYRTLNIEDIYSSGVDSKKDIEQNQTYEYYFFVGNEK